MPIRSFGIVDRYDDLADRGCIPRRDQDGPTLIVDRTKLTKRAKAKAIKALEEIVSELED